MQLLNQVAGSLVRSGKLSMSVEGDADSDSSMRSPHRKSKRVVREVQTRSVPSSDEYSRRCLFALFKRDSLAMMVSNRE